MQNKFLAEDLRKIADQINNIAEADAAPAANTPADPAAADAKATADVTDLMTHEKKPTKLTGTLAVKNLAQLLGIENSTLFAAAFNNLRQGKLPSNTAQIRELAIAFDKLLAADASTTGKVLNQLRRIHKSS